MREQNRKITKSSNYSIMVQVFFNNVKKRIIMPVSMKFFDYSHFFQRMQNGLLLLSDLKQ